MIELNKIYCESCEETLSRMDDNSIDLIITSPPYNKGFYSSVPDNAIWKKSTISYDTYNDNMQPQEYEDSQKHVISECLRFLKPTGSIFYNHKDIINNGLIVHPKYVYSFPVHQVIIWNRLNSPMISTKYYLPVTEYFFWIVKDKKQTLFNRSNCGKFSTNVWARVANKQANHPAPFPYEIIGNIINCCTNENDIVYDPYMGGGTTAVAAVLQRRNYIGSEISEKYVSMAEKRIKEATSQITLF